MISGKIYPNFKVLRNDLMAAFKKAFLSPVYLNNPNKTE